MFKAVKYKFDEYEKKDKRYSEAMWRHVQNAIQEKGAL
jgi:hypothetical protein